MKIYFYINTLGGGGAERAITNLSKSFCKDGHFVGIISSFKSNNEYSLPNVIKKYYLEIHTSKNFIKRNYIRTKELKEIIKKENPDILISFMREANARTVLACIGLKTKCIISVRNDPKIDYVGFFNSIVVKHILTRADGCVFQTREAQSFFPEKLQKKSTVLYNAVMPDFFNVKREPVPFTIVTCGRLEPQKNTALLIDAISLLINKYPQIKLEIYGEGSLKESLEKKINDLGCSLNVFLMGRTNDVISVLSKADIFVLPSDYEGMPNALMEALAAGVPCISTDCPCGGPRELITNGENGLLVPVGDSQKLAKAIDNLLQNKGLKEELGRNAQKRSEEFQPDKIYKQWKEYCEEIIQTNE